MRPPQPGCALSCALRLPLRRRPPGRHGPCPTRCPPGCRNSGRADGVPGLAAAAARMPQRPRGAASMAEGGFATEVRHSGRQRGWRERSRRAGTKPARPRSDASTSIARRYDVVLFGVRGGNRVSAPACCFLVFCAFRAFRAIRAHFALSILDFRIFCRARTLRA